MQCQEFREQLEQSLESSSLLEADLLRHGEDCHSLECRRAWEEFRLLEQAIEDWRVSRVRSPQISAPVPAAWQTRGTRSQLLLRRSSVLVAALGCLFLCGWVIVERQSGLSGGRVVAGRSEEADQIAGLRTMSGSGVMTGAEATPGALVLMRDASPAGLLVNWVAGTPLQVSGSMALLLLGHGSQEPQPSGWVPVWMEGWSEQVVPSMDDIELLRTLLLDPQARQSQLHLGHSEQELA